MGVYAVSCMSARRRVILYDVEKSLYFAFAFSSCSNPREAVAHEDNTAEYGYRENHRLHPFGTDVVQIRFAIYSSAPGVPFTICENNLACS
jgi:hypothetical protein